MVGFGDWIVCFNSATIQLYHGWIDQSALDVSAESLLAGFIKTMEIGVTFAANVKMQHLLNFDHSHNINTVLYFKIKKFI